MNNRIKYQKEDTNQFCRRLSPLTKLSTQSRPFSRVKSVNEQRKKPWNRRFIYNKIPDYDSTKDKNVVNPKKLRISSMKKNNIFDINYITYQQSKMYQDMKKNSIKGFNRTMSGFFTHYSGRNKEFGNNRNIISPSTNSMFTKNTFMKNINNTNMSMNINLNINDEKFNEIKKLWNELSILVSYKELFITIYNQLSGEEKEQLIKKEINELNTVKNDIRTLNYYIEQRNLVLKDLYKQNKKLNISKYNDANSNHEILVEISNLIEKLRESTVDVCYAMKKFKNDINNVSNLAKYNVEIICNKNNFDKNYLIKMKGELNFLKEGKAKNFFNLNNDRSPFLLKTSETNMNMTESININNKHSKEFFMKTVPLKEEIKEHINDCNYYIYQELIAYQQNIIAKNKIFRCVSSNNIEKTNYNFNNNFTYKENDITSNNFKNYGLNESSLYKKMNKNAFNDYSNINGFNSTNNFFDNKKLKNIENFLKQKINSRSNKDLFSQKLFSAFMPPDIPDIGNNLLIEDEKVKDLENEEEEEEEEEKEGSEEEEDNTTKNELNDLIEEKKDETDNNENSGNSKDNNKNRSKKLTESDNNIKKEEINNINNSKNINIKKNDDNESNDKNNRNKDNNNINKKNSNSFVSDNNKDNISRKKKNSSNNNEVKSNGKNEENKNSINNKEDNKISNEDENNHNGNEIIINSNKEGNKNSNENK